jgi:DNA-directed RNA polymerase specialized sigma24 family protein
VNLFAPWRFRAPAEDHERIFVERLTRVMHWARQIAGGDASLAEDLAQDAFLHFTAGRPSLAEISNIDKYLYVVLKNLFRSHLAAVGRRCAVAFDPLAHESAMQTWRSVDPERRLALREKLCRICIFVCHRKETSKGASAFLLHFFQGVSVSDVSRVMQTSRAAVDERLSIVRKEVRRYLERRSPVLLKCNSGETELMTELQSMIAASCHGECFSVEEARRSYAPGAVELSRERLAHLASCSKCLRLVSEILEFRPPSASPPSASADGNRLSRWQRKRAELLLTEPDELRLIVNGHVLATERVHRPDSDFSVSIALHEPLDFVEIWNGETARLLFLPGISEPPEGKYDQQASIDLDAGRLQLTLRFQDPWPTVAVSYAARPSENLARTPEQSGNPLDNIPFQQKITRPFWWGLSLPTLSTAIAVALIIVLVLVQTPETTLRASELLDRAERWEKAATTTQAPVLHRRFRLIKQRKGVGVQTSFVDVWRRAGLKVKLSRWTDGTGHVLAEAQVALSGSIHIEQGNIWQFEPSTEAFISAVGPLDDATVSTTVRGTSIRAGFAELVLDRTTNRPIGEHFSLDTADYVFTEALTETIPLAGSPLFPSEPEPRPANKRIRGSNESRHSSLPPSRPDSLIEERELQVRRELHNLELGTAASITTHDNAIEVQFAPTSAARERALAAAIEKIPGVNVSILSAKAAVLHAVTTGTPMSETLADRKAGEPLASKWLKPILRSASEVYAEEERRLQAARHLVGLVAEWRLLAERYPATIEPHLTARADSILRTMVGDVRGRIEQEIRNERIAIVELLRNTSSSPDLPGPELRCETWQSQAVRAADLLWENEQAIEEFYAPVQLHGATIQDKDLLLRLRRLTDTSDSLLRLSCE